MDERMAAVREEVSAWRSGGRRPFPLRLRRKVVALAGSEARQGRSTFWVARQLGLGVQLLQRWLGEKPRGAGFRRVQVAAAAESGVAVLVTRQGHRIEGLDLAGLAALLERLG